jgi:hypothetical protein
MEFFKSEKGGGERRALVARTKPAGRLEAGRADPERDDEEFERY